MKWIHVYAYIHVYIHISYIHTVRKASTKHGGRRNGRGQIRRHTFGQGEYMYVCIYACVYVCVYVYILDMAVDRFGDTPLDKVSMCMYVDMCVCVYIYIYIYIYIYKSVCV